MYQKILVPLDSSAFAECALEHVKELVGACGVGSVTLIYVVEPMNPAVYETSPEFIEKVLQAGIDFAHDYLNRTAGELKTGGLKVETVVAQGHAAEAILEYATANHVDLIVMSTHGRSGVSRWLLGSVADRVVHGSTISVFLVPPAGCRMPGTAPAGRSSKPI